MEASPFLLVWATHKVNWEMVKTSVVLFSASFTKRIDFKRPLFPCAHMCECLCVCVSLPTGKGYLDRDQKDSAGLCTPLQSWLHDCGWCGLFHLFLCGSLISVISHITHLFGIGTHHTPHRCFSFVPPSLPPLFISLSATLKQKQMGPTIRGYFCSQTCLSI